jgi:hypothetical protein
MSAGRLNKEMLIAARICAGLGTVLNWGGKRFKPADFMPGKPQTMQIDTKQAFRLLSKALIK